MMRIIGKVLGALVLAAVVGGGFASWVYHDDAARHAALDASCPQIMAAVHASTSYRPLTPEIIYCEAKR
jgi:hypothetical protein